MMTLFYPGSLSLSIDVLRNQLAAWRAIRVPSLSVGTLPTLERAQPVSRQSVFAHVYCSTNVRKGQEKSQPIAPPQGLAFLPSAKADGTPARLVEVV